MCIIIMCNIELINKMFMLSQFYSFEIKSVNSYKQCSMWKKSSGEFTW